MTTTLLPLRLAPTAAGATPAAQLAAVSKSYGTVTAVSGLTLTVGRGETVALLGPNGAGKTTTIAMLLGLIAPDDGDVRILGDEPRQAVAAGQVGAMLQDGGLMSGVRVRELLAMVRTLYAAPLTIEEACWLAQLDGVENRFVDRLSGGQVQRLRVAVALVGNPQVLVLDEPTAAMDVEARRRFWQAMDEQAARGRTILFSTHLLEEADEHSDRIVVIGAGRLLADGSPAAIKASVGMRSVSLSVDRDADGLARLPGVTSLTVRGRRVQLLSTDTDSTLRALIANRPDARDIDVTGARLEEAFIALTTGRPL